jgi:hypothetical protein
MPRLKLRIVHKGIMPTASEIKDIIGNRIMHRTSEPIKSDSQETKHPDPEFLDADHDNATLVTSMTTTGWHMPVIDIDLPCMLVPSSRPGHFHLYINKKMPFEDMLDMLRAMNMAGVVQDGIIHHVQRRGYASVRYPGVTKENEKQRIEDTKGE